VRGATATHAAGPAWRRTPSLPIISAGAATAALLWWRAAVAGDDLLVVARAVGVAIAAASAMVVADPAESITDVAPFGRSRRRLIAVVLTGVVAVVTWAAVVGIATRLAPSSDVRMAPLFVEFIGMCVFGWTLGYGGLALLGGDSAARAAFAVPLAVVCSIVMPWSRQRLWEHTDHDRNWMVLIVVGVALGGWISRDVAARSVVRRTAIAPRG
jgi:hypothetical protein